MQYITAFKVNRTFLNLVLIVILICKHSAQQNSVFQHYYQSYWNYLLKMGSTDEEKAVFVQLTLSHLKMLVSAASRTL